MVTFIKMEYVVASAIVELFRKKQLTQVSFTEIESYGFKVEEVLSNKNTRAILLYSNYYTKEFLNDYSEFFEEKNDSILLREGVGVDDLYNHILCYAPIDILIALSNKKTLSVLI